jgi:hypothetical protein
MALPVSTQIKDMLIERIEVLESVQKVYPSSVINNSGWPAVAITAQSEEGEFSSNAENSRIYSFNATVLFPVGQDFVPEEERERTDYAERVVAQVIEDVMNAVDKDYELDRGVVLFVNAADVEWAYFEYEGGVARGANVILNVYTELNVIT